MRDCYRAQKMLLTKKKNRKKKKVGIDMLLVGVEETFCVIIKILSLLLFKF